MRFTDTHTVFIFILVSFYRTFLRFPHRPTIPAYEIRSHCITCIICFLWQVYRLPMPAQFINRIAGLERFWEVSAVPLPFLPFLVYVYSRPPSQVIIFHCYSNNVLHLQGFILWTLARFFVLLLLLLISRLNITFLFEKQLTAFNNEESANIA